MSQRVAASGARAASILRARGVPPRRSAALSCPKRRLKPPARMAPVNKGAVVGFMSLRAEFG